MSFRATRQLLIGVALSGIILSVARGEDPQPGSFDADAMAGRLCIRYVHSDLVSDARTESVRDFLEDHHCQIAGLAPEFVLAADLNQIDYRLLPTLSVLETGCGRATRNNNLFGWANGRKPFATMRQGIHHVAQRLRLGCVRRRTERR